MKKPIGLLYALLLGAAACVDVSGPCPDGLPPSELAPEQFQTTEVTILPPPEQYPGGDADRAFEAYAYDVAGSGQKVNEFGKKLQIINQGALGENIVSEIHQLARDGLLNVLLDIKPLAWPARCGEIRLRPGMPKTPDKSPTPALGVPVAAVPGAYDDRGFDVRLPSTVPAGVLRPLVLHGSVQGTPVRVPMYVNHVQADRSGDELSGQIHGVLKKTDVDQIFLSDVATALTLFVRHNEPGKDTSLSRRSGDVIAAVGDCKPTDFRTCVVPVGRVRADRGDYAILPDVKMFDNGAYRPQPNASMPEWDSVSFGLGFRARRTQVEEPQCSAPDLCLDSSFPLRDPSCTAFPYPDSVVRIHGTTPSDVWVVRGWDFVNPSPILHFDGIRWTSLLPTALQRKFGTGFFRTVWARSPYEVYSGVDSDLVRYDGIDWRVEPMDPSFQGSIWDIVGVDGALFVVGEVNASLVLFRRRAGVWSRDPLFPAIATKREDTWRLQGADGRLCLAGRVGLYCTDINPNGQDSEWKEQQSFRPDDANKTNLLVDLMDLAVLSRNEAWTITRQGDIYRLQGGAWGPQPKGAISSLNALWAESPERLFAVGIKRWRWDGDALGWSDLGTIDGARKRNGFSVWSSGDSVFVGTNCGLLRSRP